MFRPTISRRDCVVAGSLFGGLLGSQLLRRNAVASFPVDGFGAARRCVLVWLDGGPSHLETFDPKPDAPEEVRGPLGTIATKLSGVRFSEGLPSLANMADQFSVVRSMTSPVGEHNLATNYALSGHIPGGRAQAPAFLLPASQYVDHAEKFPVHIAVPDFQLGGGAKLGGFMDKQFLPWSLGTEPAQATYREQLFASPGAPDRERLVRRRALLDAAGEQNASLQDAISILTDPASQAAFDLSREPAKTRQRYGEKPIGQNCLLARRLLDSGVPIVTVNNKGWDTHNSLKTRLYDGYTGAKRPVGLVPAMDKAVSALLSDLTTNGMIDETLVIVMGEFGRTPKINTLGGRDHWPRAYSVLLAGAGVKRGCIHGSSDRVGENAADSPVTPADLVATVFHLLGIEPHERVATPDGQSMTRVPEQAQVVRGILS